MFRRVLLVTALSVVLASAASAATVSYTARLSGRAEVPKTDSKGKGRLKAEFDTTSKVLNYTLSFEGLSGPATAAHIHGPATRAQSAGVVVPLGEKNPTSPITGSATLTEDQVKYLQSSKLYVNVHTAANPGGEIRGQMIGVHARRKGRPAATESGTEAPSASAPAESTPPAAAPK
ncbi:CHRD domain-containing protein [Rhodopila sp.]|uniref:CHRD domain-containing protein n=1 Tax=Rhodopila sp. TaxID=2480087 RepID=UPI003D122628